MRTPSCTPRTGFSEVRLAATAAAALAAAVLAWPAAALGPARGMPADTALRRLIAGSHGLNLRGKQVSWSMAAGGPQRMCVQRIVRRADGRSLVESLEPAGQRGATTVEDGTWRKAWDPGTHRLTVTRAMPRVASKEAVERMVRLVHRNYRVSVGPIESIGGRDCYRVRFSPRTPISHTVQVWVDAATGAVLGHQESDWRTETLSMSYFVAVQYPRRIALSEVTFRVPRRASVVNSSLSPLLRSLAAAQRRAGFAIALPLAMPGGFEFEHAEVISAPGVRAVCLHYTDGIANISVFESPSRTPRRREFRETVPMRHTGTDVVGVSYAVGSMDCMVLGHGELQGMVAVAHSLDPERERAWMARLSREFHVSPAAVAELRDGGLSISVVSALLRISARTGRPVRRLVALSRQGWSCGSIARSSGLDAASAESLFETTGMH